MPSRGGDHRDERGGPERSGGRTAAADGFCFCTLWMWVSLLPSTALIALFTQPSSLQSFMVNRTSMSRPYATAIRSPHRTSRRCSTIRTTPTGGRPARAQLLVTCLIDRLFPDTGFAVVRVLERLGIEVSCPDAQTCCGQPAFNAGAVDDARAMARHTIDVLSASPDPVVIPSGSCGDMVIHQYPHLFDDDPAYAAKARALAARTYEFSQFLVQVCGVIDVGAHASGTLTYHACCHGLRGLNVRDEPPAHMAGVKGAKICPLAESDVCCGFGGLFAVKMADIS